MKALKVLNKINEAVLFLYIPFVLIDFENIFHNGDKKGVTTLLCLCIFFATFICGGITLIMSAKRGVESAYSLADLQSTNKAEILLVTTVAAVGMVIFAVNSKDELKFFYLMVNAISLVFVIGENIVIHKIDTSPYYKIHIPVIICLLPVALFLPAEMFALNRVAEKYETAAGLGIFALCGIVMAYCAWHSYYLVDTQHGTVEKNYGIFQIFKGGKSVLVCNRLQRIEESGLYYTLIEGDKKMKINKFYSNARKLKRVLTEQGVPVIRE